MPNVLLVGTGGSQVECPPEDFRTCARARCACEPPASASSSYVVTACMGAAKTCRGDLRYYGASYFFLEATFKRFHSATLSVHLY